MALFASIPPPPPPTSTPMAITPNVPEPSSASDVPKTPERGRSQTRYPSHLSRQLDSEGKPRPFLHRRGTSHTYETLEDLLREAGYKETRVFTPEMERREAEREEQKEREGKQAKAGRDASGVGGAVVKLFSAWMPTRRTSGTDPDAADDAAKPCPPSPLAHRTKKPLSNTSTLHLPSPSRSSSSSTLTVRPSNTRYASLRTLQHQHSLTRQPSTLSRTAFPTSSTSTSAFHPHSRARMELRHAVSVPHIDKRRTRTQPRSRPNKTKVPPLPVTWLESISAALLSPRLQAPPPPTPSRRGPRRPAFVSHRAHTSPSAVTITNVLCRSAPSSRSSSAVRPSRALVPTLAQTRVCEELASSAWPPHSPHHLPRDAPVEDYDDGDEELNLSMMLIPSKRQHSIRSLRSVLLQHHSLPSSASMREEYARVLRRRIDETEEGGDVDGHWDSGEFLTARVKRRRSGLPSNWGWSS